MSDDEYGDYGVKNPGWVPVAPMTDDISAEQGKRYEHHGNASLDVIIRNGPALMVNGTGLTTEQACDAVASYLPVASPFDSAPPRSVVLTPDQAEIARKAIEETWVMQADDEPNPNAATLTWRELRRQLSRQEAE